MMRLGAAMLLVSLFGNAESFAFVGGKSLMRPSRCVAAPSARTAYMSAVASIPLVGLEFQLEEMEDKETSATSVTLQKDGSIKFGATDGPLPISSAGTWEMKGDDLFMVVTREYDGSFPYSVTRTYHGSIEQIFQETKTLFLSGDIKMEDAEVGYFKMISAPNDIEDAVSHLDEKIKEEHVV